MSYIKPSTYSMRSYKNYIILSKHYCPECKSELRASAICASHMCGPVRREEIFAKFHCDKCKKAFSVQTIRRHEQMQKHKKIEY